jgi:KDO2-lipid IV(A) lauroyltransferase
LDSPGIRKKTQRKIIAKLGSVLFFRAQKSLRRKSPEKAAEAGARLGRIMARVSKKHWNRALSNLKLAFPELPEEQRSKLALNAFEHFGMIGAEFLTADRRDPDKIFRKSKVVGVEHIAAAKRDGNGVLIITAHLGHWEMGGQYFRWIGDPLAVIAREANEDAMTKEVERLRSIAGMEVIHRDKAAITSLRLLKKGRLVAILPDQNSDDCFVPFFGHTAGTVLGPAVIHKRTGAPLLPVFVYRECHDQYTIMIEEPMRFDPEEDPEVIMTEINKIIENAVRRRPEQYLWFHDRWKSARQRGLV